MTFVRLSMVLILVSLVNVSCTSTPAKDNESTQAFIGDNKPVKPFYRFWRGYKKAGMSQKAYIEKMGKEFVPTAPRIHAKNGLVSYLVAVPPAVHPKEIPDELALLAYESQAVYEKARATPEGIAYADLHWTIFEKSNSKSEVPLDYFTLKNPQIEKDIAYDIVSKPIDWQKGHSFIFIGLKKKKLSEKEFLQRMKSHVELAYNSFKDQGLLGYVMLASGTYEIAYMNWTSEEAATKALASPAGLKVQKDSGEIFDNLMWQVAKEFKGTLKADEFVNLKFNTRQR